MSGLENETPFPSAVFATSDPVALGVLHWCQERSITVPGQLSVIGFDDIELSRIAGVRLSTVCFPVREIAAAAVEHLQGLIERSGDLPAPTRRQFEPVLVARASTARPVGIGREQPVLRAWIVRPGGSLTRTDWQRGDSAGRKHLGTMRRRHHRMRQYLGSVSLASAQDARSRGSGSGGHQQFRGHRPGPRIRPAAPRPWTDSWCRGTSKPL